MFKKILFLFIVTSFFTATSQVGIGTTTPNPSAALHIESNTGGLLIPSMTLTQRNAIASPAEGLMIYQTTEPSGFYHYKGTTWEPFSSDSKWIRIGDDIYNENTGKVGIGTTAPTAKLHVKGDAVQQYFNGFETNAFPPFTTAGSVFWQITNYAPEVYAGNYAARTRAMTHNQYSHLRLTRTLPSDGMISFAVKTSTENNKDWLTFYIDEVQQDRWSGETPYRVVSFPVSAGAHNFRWTYTKDAAGDAGDDRVVIDNVSLSTGSHGFRLEGGDTAAGNVLTSDGSGNAIWTTPVEPDPIPDPIPSLWTANGANIHSSNSGNVGVGVTNPSHKFAPPNAKAADKNFSITLYCTYL